MTWYRSIGKAFPYATPEVLVFLNRATIDNCEYEILMCHVEGKQASIRQWAS